MTITRSTISFTQQNWQGLKNAPNRSKLVNKALSYYFKAQNFIKNKEEEFLLLELADYQQNPTKGKTFEEIFGESI